MGLGFRVRRKISWGNRGFMDVLEGFVRCFRVFWVFQKVLYGNRKQRLCRLLPGFHAFLTGFHGRFYKGSECRLLGAWVFYRSFMCVL